MRHNFTTCFDSNYLVKGVAMIRSLLRHSPDAFVDVLAMDKATGDALVNLFDNDIAVYDMNEFEQRTGMDQVRKTRTHQEYCWTCGAVFTKEVADYWKDDVTYLDADCFFFSDPEVVFDEIGDKSIGITPHRFAKADEARLLPNGKYAVQWVTFKGEVGRKCLNKWASQVREWCFYRHQDGKFGDQLYLNEWPELYPGEVCEISNIGVGTAPWNVAKYFIETANGRVIVADESLWGPLVMYHFHEYLHGERLTNWPLPRNAKELIYAPYIKAIQEAQELIDGDVIPDSIRVPVIPDETIHL